MAKATRKLPRLLDGMRGSLIPEKLDQTEKAVQYAQPVERFTDAERDMLFRAVTGNTVQNQPQLSFEELTRRRLRHGGSNHQENDRIIRMTPQVSRAMEIIIASIISPNDLRKDRIRFTNTETSLNDDEREKLQNLASEFFEERFSLSTVLAKWIEVALYRTGAKILLTIPSGSLEQELLGQESISAESFSAQMKTYASQSVFGFGEVSAEMLDSIATESFSSVTETVSLVAEDFGVKVPTDMTGDHKEALKKFISAEALSLTDNPAILRAAPQKSQLSAKKLETALAQYRKKAVRKGGQNKDTSKILVQLSHSDRDKMGEPLFLDANAESCVPIYVPGSPSNHIGYIFCIDEHGNLARVDPNGENTQNGYGFEESDKMDFGPIYGAFGFNNSLGRQSGIGSTISAIYGRVVETYLAQRVQKAGLDGVNIGSNPAIYRYMFSQYMARRQVRLIFVPADMVTYFAFEYDEHGCGVSKLEDVKFPLSLRTAAAVGRAMNFINNGMPLRQITLNTNNANHAYQLQTLAKIQNADILKRTYSLTSNPDNAIGQMAERAYTFKINGGAGFEWSIDNTQAERGVPQIDDEYFREVNNEIILGLGAPPATMNAMNEDQYSRSVATTNLTFSATTLESQKIVITHTSSFCRRYGSYSEFFRGEVAKIIRSEKDNDSTQDEVGSLAAGAGDAKRDETDTRIDDIIDSFSIVLPPPRIAPDIAQYEHAERITQWVTSTIDAVWPESLAGDDAKMKEALEIRKVMAKNMAIRKLLSDIGMPDIDFLEFNNVPVSDILAGRQSLRNLTAALASQDAGLTPEASPEGGDDFKSFNAASSATPPEDDQTNGF